MRELIIRDAGALAAYQELARLLAGKCESYLRYSEAIKKGLRLFVSRTERLSTGGASEKAILIEPSDSLTSFLAALRAGEREFNLFIEDVIRH